MKYISLLRGINVSGQKKIKMAELKSLYENEGFECVTTYIQSGNVLFESTFTESEKVKARIETAINEMFGFEVSVDVRTTDEYKKIVNNCPYNEVEQEENRSKILVSFLSGVPSVDRAKELEKLTNPPEKLKIMGSVVFLYCPNGYGRSKLSNTFIESKLGLVSTTRNWKTVLMLCELGQ